MVLFDPYKSEVGLSLEDDSEWSSVKDTGRFDSKNTPGFIEENISFREPEEH